MTAVAAARPGRQEAWLHRVEAWLHRPEPVARVAVLRLLVLAFVPVDVLLTSRWVAAHADLPATSYRPLLVARLLHLPAPTPLLVHGVEVALLLAAAAALAGALTGRASRLLGALVFVLYVEWMVIAMSYGKVDHDRFAYLVALAVLPTVGAARLRYRSHTAEAGWALRCVELAVVATYFLSTVAKLRFGGWGWPNSGVLTWALLRRAHGIALPLLHHPGVLLAAQWGIVAMELATPLLLVLPVRLRPLAVAGLLSFHLITFATIGIIFLPHLVALCAFLPLERLVPAASRPALVPRQAPAP